MKLPWIYLKDSDDVIAELKCRNLLASMNAYIDATYKNGEGSVVININGVTKIFTKEHDNSYAFIEWAEVVASSYLKNLVEMCEELLGAKQELSLEEEALLYR